MLILDVVGAAIAWLSPPDTALYWYSYTLVWAVSLIALVGAPACITALALEWIDARISKRRHAKA